MCEYISLLSSETLPNLDSGNRLNRVILTQTLFFPHHLEFWSFLMCFGALKSLHEINYVTLSLSTFKYSI